MTPSEIVPLVEGVVSACAVLFGAVYMRGKLDQHAKDASSRLDVFGQKIDKLEAAQTADAVDRGGQLVLNANAARSALEASDAKTLAIKVEERQSAHERGCDQRQTAIVERFNKTDEKIEHLGAEIRNLALGIANQATVIPANARRIGQ